MAWTRPWSNQTMPPFHVHRWQHALHRRPLWDIVCLRGRRVAARLNCPQSLRDPISYEPMQKIISLAITLAFVGWHGALGIAKGQAADVAETNVALASAGAVAIADSSYGGHVASFVNDGKWIGPGDRPESNRWHGALRSEERRVGE